MKVYVSVKANVNVALYKKVDVLFLLPSALFKFLLILSCISLCFVRIKFVAALSMSQFCTEQSVVMMHWNITELIVVDSNFSGVQRK